MEFESVIQDVISQSLLSISLIAYSISKTIGILKNMNLPQRIGTYRPEWGGVTEQEIIEYVCYKPIYFHEILQLI